MLPMDSRVARLWERVEIKYGPDGCWLWTGNRTRNGYGRMIVDRHVYYVHRFVYELRVESIPAGLELDHLCRNRLCCNPAHLEPVTHQENVRRGTSPTMLAHLKDECLKGHALVGLNVIEIVDRGRKRRECRECRNARQRRYYARNKASA